jgi:hypothetical protein
MSSPTPFAPVLAFTLGLLASATSLNAAAPADNFVREVPRSTVFFRADFSALKDLDLAVPAGTTVAVPGLDTLPVSKPDIGVPYQPIDQGRQLSVTATAPVGAPARVVATANVGGPRQALSILSPGAEGASLTLEVRNLVPGQGYAATALVNGQSSAPVPAGRMRVTGAGLDLPTQDCETFLPESVRTRRLLVPFVAPADGTVQIHLVNLRAEAPFHVRSIDVLSYPIVPPVPPPETIPAPGHTFAFDQVKWTDLRVAVDHPAAADTNPGTTDHPLKTLAAALTRATPLLRDGTPVRILLAAGVYREGRSLDRKSHPLLLNAARIGGLAETTPLAIIGEAPGRVILSGADLTSPTDWILADAKTNLWKHPWPYNWGPSDNGFFKPTKPLEQRTELILVAGARARQRLIEEMTYAEGAYVHHSPGMGRNDPGRWTLGAYAGPGILQPGEFGVSEFGPGETIQGLTYDGHPDPDTLWLRLPPGQSPQTHPVEIALRTGGLRINAKDKLWLKNLDLRHYRGEPLAMNGHEDARFNREVLIEAVAARENHLNSTLDWLQGVTIRDSEFSGNSRGEGLNFYFNRDALVVRTTFAGNGWRWPGYTSGIHLAGQNLRFEDCVFKDNAKDGIQTDHIGQYLAFIRCRSENNGAGAFFETALGPVLIQDSDFLNNRGPGLWFAGTSGVTLENSRIIGNVTRPNVTQPGGNTSQIQITCNARYVHGYALTLFRSEYWVPFPYAERFVFRDNVIAGRGADTGLISHKPHNEKLGAVKAYVEWYRTQFTASGNRYWQPDNPTPFHLNGEWDPAKRERTDLAGWQKATTQDQDSRWQAP